MSRSGKGKAVDREPQRSSYEDEYSEDDYDTDDWKNTEDPGERRKIQNRLAQRKFREKTKTQKEDSIRHSQNQAAARNAYTHPDPRDLEHSNAQSGLPWGGVSIKHVVERGKAREQSQYEQSARESREASAAYDRGGRESSVSYYGSDRGGRETPSYYSTSRGSSGGGYPAVSRGTSESDRAYYSRGRGDYSR